MAAVPMGAVTTDTAGLTRREEGGTHGTAPDSSVTKTLCCRGVHRQPHVWRCGEHPGASRAAAGGREAFHLLEKIL